MKLSNETWKILKNFSGINQGILFNEGNDQFTITEAKTILAHAKTEEEFPGGHAVYDLNKLLALLEMFDNPDLEFTDDNLVISSEGSKSIFRFADVEMVNKPKAMKPVDMPEPDVKFELSEAALSKILDAAGILDSPDLLVSSEGKNITLSAVDLKNPSSNRFSLNVGVLKKQKDFNYVLKPENLSKIIQGSYSVALSGKGISHFKNTDREVEYWIALDERSEEEE